MILMQKKMYIIRRKGTNKYMRSNTYLRDLNSDSKSAIRLYETEAQAKSAVRRFIEDYDFLPVKVTIETEE